MTKTERIAHLTKQLNEWTAMLHKSRKNSRRAMCALQAQRIEAELATLKKS